jgi:hypothetical protein
LELGEIHLVVFHSQPFNSTELNYDVHNKELFAIYEVFHMAALSGWLWASDRCCEKPQKSGIFFHNKDFKLPSGEVV